MLYHPESYYTSWYISGWAERYLSVSFRYKHGSQLHLNSLEVRNFIWTRRPLLHLRTVPSLISTKQTCWAYTQLPKMNASQLTISISPKANCHISRSSKVARPFTIAPSGVSQWFYSYGKCSRLQKLAYRNYHSMQQSCPVISAILS